MSDWSRSQWRFLLAVFILAVTQITLGFLTVQFGLQQPMFTVAHQLVATLLVACLGALSCRRLEVKKVSLPSIIEESLFEILQKDQYVDQ